MFSLFSPDVEKLVKKNDLPALIRCLEHRDSRVRISAFNALFEKKDEAEISSRLKSHLKDRDIQVKANAVLAYSKIGDEGVYKDLLEIFINGGEFLKMNILRALSELESTENPYIFNIIALALNDKRNFIRLKTIRTIGYMRNSHFIYSLSELLHDDNSNIRLEALRSLTKIGGEDTEKYLISALMDSNRNVSKFAHDTLIQSGSASARQALKDEKYLEIKKDIGSFFERRLNAVKKIGDLRLKEALPLLVMALTDKYKNIRVEAVKSLRIFHDPKTEKALERLLTDEYSEVRIEAIKTLRRIETEEALTAIEKVLKDENTLVRKEAESAFFELKNILINKHPEK